MEITATFYHTGGVEGARDYLRQIGVQIIGERVFPYVGHPPQSRGIPQPEFKGQGVELILQLPVPPKTDEVLTRNYGAGAVTLGRFQQEN